MTYRPKKLCDAPRCTELIDVGQKFCEEHKPKVDLRPSRSNGDPYSTARWRRLRKKILSREPFCRECMKEGRATIATDVDHIKSHRGDPKLFWDEKNLQPLCHRHHSQKTAEEDRVYEYRY